MPGGRLVYILEVVGSSLVGSEQSGGDGRPWM